MEREHSPERLQGLLEVIRLGHTDCDESTALWIPSIRLLVAGDAVYGNTHPYMGEPGSLNSRLK